MSNIELFIQVASAIVVILIVAQIFARLATMVGQPTVVGEMISGVVLGPTVFGYFLPETSAFVFPKTVMPFLFVISNLGLSIYMFIVGMEMDHKLFKKDLLKQSAALSVVAVVLPFLCGAYASYLYFDTLSGKEASPLSFAIFLGTAFAITAFPMMARILQEKNLLNTKLGSIAILSASIQDVASWILLSFVTADAMKQGYDQGLWTLLGAFVFVGALFLFIKPLMKKMGDHTEANGELSRNNFSLLIISLIVAALVTDHIGLYSVFGGFMLGLIMPRGKTFQHEVKSKIKDFSSIAFLPLFFSFSGLNADLTVLKDFSVVIPCVVILALAIGGKYFPSLGIMRYTGFTWKESFAMAGLVNARGLMELIVVNIGIMYGVISKDLYSICILLAIVSTLVATPLYKIAMGKEDERADKEKIQKRI